MQQDIVFILIISVLGPIIGSFIGVIKKPSEKIVYNMLAFAGGVMLSISFLELIPESIRISSIPVASLGITLGAVAMYVLDKALPHIHPELCTQEPGHKLRKTSAYLLVGIFMHNFPEGMAIALGAVSHSETGLLIAIAIAVHNIPEGICTAAPYYSTTRNRFKSFLVSSMTAFPVIVGFLVATALYSQIADSMIGLVVGATAGLMIYITSDEIIPASSMKNSDHTTIFSLMAGILFVVLLGVL